MGVFFYWFGVIHVAAYALAGFSMAFYFFVNWIAERFKLKADMLKVLHTIYKARAAKRDGPRIGA